MLEFLTDLNDWIKSHVELVAVVGVPTLTLVVTKLSNISTEKRALKDRRVERELTREIKLSDFRQAWIDELRLEFSRFLGFLQGSQPMPHERINEMTLCYNKIMLRLNHNDSDFPLLVSAMTNAMEVATHEPSREAQATAHSDLLVKMHEILKTEWERLKRDLADSETLKVLA